MHMVIFLTAYASSIIELKTGCFEFLATTRISLVAYSHVKVL